MHWQDYIVSNKEVLNGKPTIKDTRLSVEFKLERFADGWSEKDILENYPRLSKKALQAFFAYAYKCLKDGLLFHSSLSKAA